MHSGPKETTVEPPRRQWFHGFFLAKYSPPQRVRLGFLSGVVSPDSTRIYQFWDRDGSDVSITSRLRIAVWLFWRIFFILKGMRCMGFEETRPGPTMHKKRKKRTQRLRVRVSHCGGIRLLLPNLGPAESGPRSPVQQLGDVINPTVASITQAPWGGSTFKPLNSAWDS